MSYSWIETTLDKVIRIKHGFAFKGQFFCNKGSHVVLTPGNFFEKGGFKTKEQEKFYNGPIPEEYILTRGDLIVAMTEQAEGLLGSTAFVPKSGVYLHNQRIGLIQPLADNIALREFLYYLFNWHGVRSQIRATCSGAKVRHTSPSRIYETRVKLPAPPTQKKIAAILSAYDDLIENNERRIRILEEMAQNLYREWFVKFRFPNHEKVKMVDSPLGKIPQGWEVGRLNDIVENLRNSTHAGDHLQNRNYVPIDCIGKKTLTLSQYQSWEEAQSSLILFEKGDVLFGAMRPYFHKVAVAPFSGVTRTTCFVLRAREHAFRGYAAYLLFQDETVAFANAHSRGATIPYAAWEDSMSEMAVVVPDKDVATCFSEFVMLILDLSAGLATKNATLRRTRDLLLPKLISGEVDVSELDIEVEDVA